MTLFKDFDEATFRCPLLQSADTFWFFRFFFFSSDPWKCPKGTLQKGALRIYLNFTWIAWIPRILLELHLNFTRMLLEF